MKAALTYDPGCMSESITLGTFTYSFHAGGFELTDADTASVYFYPYRYISCVKFSKGKRVKIYLRGREYIYICLPESEPVGSLVQIYKALLFWMNGPASASASVSASAAPPGI
jgi:hypothetical protein